MVADVRRREITQEKAESFALYKQQLSIGLNVLVTLLTAAIVGYALGRHFIDVNNKAGPYIVAGAFAVIMLLVEVVLVVSRLSRADAAGLTSAALNEAAAPPRPQAAAATAAAAARR